LTGFAEAALFFSRLSGRPATRKIWKVVKNNVRFCVIPAEAGIQIFDPGSSPGDGVVPVDRTEVLTITAKQFCGLRGPGMTLG
jgi:hypothetical protein